MRMMISGTRAPGPTPQSGHSARCPRAGMFTIGVTVLAALLFGLVPAIAAFVSAPAPALRQAIAAPPRSRRLFGNGLVIAQVAISVALLSVSQLSIAHLRHLARPKPRIRSQWRAADVGQHLARAEPALNSSRPVQRRRSAPARRFRACARLRRAALRRLRSGRPAVSCRPKDSTNPRRTGVGRR